MLDSDSGGPSAAPSGASVGVVAVAGDGRPRTGRSLPATRPIDPVAADGTAGGNERSGARTGGPNHPFTQHDSRSEEAQRAERPNH